MCKKEMVMYEHLRKTIEDKAGYIKIVDKKELERIFHFNFMLPKIYWFRLLQELEKEKIITQVCRGRGGIKYKVG